MAIRKRAQRVSKRVIFRLFVLDEKKPRAQFVASLPYDNGNVICGGKLYTAIETEIDTIPYRVDIHNDGWADYTAVQFKRAMGTKE